MRLSKHEIETIKKTARETWGNRVAVFLFGSRTDDSKRGGDIDIFIQLEEEQNPEQQLLQKVDFLTKLDLLLGEQKIDVLIKNRYNSHLPIVKMAQTKGVAL